MLRRMIPILAALALSACPDMTQMTGDPAADEYANAVRAVGVSCDTYSATMEQLVIARDLGQLSAGTRAEVTGIRNEVGPICEADNPPLVLSGGRDTLEFIKPLIARLLIYNGDPT
jgi:hypothetical protein